MSAQQDRIVALQRQVKLARDTLTKIAHGHSVNPEYTAEATLDAMWRLDPKQQLQGLVGHPTAATICGERTG